MRKCHYIHDKEAGKVLIPGCYGAMYGDMSLCTCRPEKIETEQSKEKKLIKELEKENARLWRIIKKKN